MKEIREKNNFHDWLIMCHKKENNYRNAGNNHSLQCAIHTNNVINQRKKKNRKKYFFSQKNMKVKH